MYHVSELAFIPVMKITILSNMDKLLFRSFVLDNPFALATANDISLDSCTDFSLILSPPIQLNNTGKNITPWYIPKTTVRKNTLKNVRNACEFESAKTTRAKNVVIPPFSTAGQIFIRLLCALCTLDPKTNW